MYMEQFGHYLSTATSDVKRQPVTVSRTHMVRKEQGDVKHRPKPPYLFLPETDEVKLRPETVSRTHLVRKGQGDIKHRPKPP